MTTLAIRNVPDELYARLEAAARRHKRTVEQEVLDVLNDTASRTEAPAQAAPARRPMAEILAEMDAFRARIHLPPGTPTTEEMIREDRAR
jgi:plasmid stability protein